MRHQQRPPQSDDGAIVSGMGRLRLACAALMILALPLSGAGQSSTTSRETIVPQPSIGLPLPPMGLPLPPMGLRPVPEPRVREKSGVRRGIPERHRLPVDSRKVFQQVPSFVFVVPTYGWWDPYYTTGFPYPTVAPPTVSRDEDPEQTSGTVRLEIESGNDPQVYVDSYYVGTLGDLHGELQLEAGLHQIELREAGYQPLAVNIRILAGRSIILRETMKRDDQRSEPQAPPRTDEIGQPPAHRVTPPRSSMFYVIPGCYLGNVAPTEAMLPPGCDLSQLVTYRP